MAVIVLTTSVTRQSPHTGTKLVTSKSQKETAQTQAQGPEKNKHGVMRHIIKRTPCVQNPPQELYDYKCLTAPVCENTFDSKSVFVWQSFVGSRLVELVVGQPRPSLLGTSVPWVSGRDPPVCHRVLVTSCGLLRSRSTLMCN